MIIVEEFNFGQPVKSDVMGTRIGRTLKKFLKIFICSIYRFYFSFAPSDLLNQHAMRY
jgi:hypothetical protein